ncbi:MAG TPA: glycoside hydrolase family 15 protein [Burkholderiales bacterium]|nr:glycoside hydrolase family 15 protein [Burkholderiales bacterium]
MALKIEDYALIGNTRTAALVGNDGSIDWLCLPRFDSGACFAALLGEPRHGRWRLAPAGAIKGVSRSYRDSTLVLDTEFRTAGGTVRVTDFMPLWEGRSDVVRVVEGLSGRVKMEMELVIRFDYGSVVPWVRHLNGGIVATAGPDSLEFHTPVITHGRDMTTVAEFTVRKGEVVPFVLSHFPSCEPPPLPINPLAAIHSTVLWWQEWAKRCVYQGKWRPQVLRSLITLKALTYTPTGGIVAAPTTSLPEQFGGVRNWDYRFCWLRDATFTLYALLIAGFQNEAQAWREWLLRAVAGRPADLQILYGISGERRLDEWEIPWLPGYQGASPVRIGNAAAGQMQIDVYGELMDMLHLARTSGLAPAEHAWQIQRKVIEQLESVWNKPDHGIWEIRGDPQHFTHSRVMAWVAVDRVVKAVERFGLEGPADHWRKLRDKIHKDVCDKGFDTKRNAFVQYYGARGLDASLLLIPLVGFLPPTDPRVCGTVEAIERELMQDGFVARYDTTGENVDGLPPGEGVFLPCSFWMVDNLSLMGRYADAHALFERLVGLCNDVGLIAEEYDPAKKRLCGNFPQAFTHVALINSARNLSRPGGPNEQRGEQKGEGGPASATAADRSRIVANG